MAEHQHAGGVNSEVSGRRIERRLRIECRTCARWRAGQTIVAAVLGKDDARVEATRELTSPWDHPSRNDRIAVKRNRGRNSGSRCSNHVRKQRRAVARDVRQAWEPIRRLAIRTPRWLKD